MIVDLSALPASVSRVRLANLALKSLIDIDSQTPEAIYTTFAGSVLVPSDARYQKMDTTLYGALDLPLATVMRLTLGPGTVHQGRAPTPAAPSAAAIESVLASAANDDDFVWDGTRLSAPAGAPFGPNRLVLPVSNTEGYDLNHAVNGISSGWSDVQIQIFKMRAAGNDWTLPLDIDLATGANPQEGGPTSSPKGYGLARRSFFAQERNPDVTVAKGYPALHAPTINGRSGTYKRWYVANIGNSSPLNTGAGAPDMHPFHIHLVNFVVTRRWQLDDAATGSFVPLPASALDLDLPRARTPS